MAPPQTQPTALAGTISLATTPQTPASRYRAADAIASRKRTSTSIRSSTQFGLVNRYLGLLGIPAIPWLTSTRWSLVGVSLASVWWDLGLAFVLFLAALQDVPRELYESAAVDGANSVRQFWHMTLPEVRPILSLVVTLQLIATLRIFSQVYVMTNGGPAGSSSSVIHYIYTTAVVRQLMGYSAAVSMLLFVVILGVTLVQRLVIREQGGWFRSGG